MATLEEGNTGKALQLINEGVSINEAAIRNGGSGSFALPGMLLKRSAIKLAMHDSDGALADANQAVSLTQATVQPGSFSSKMGLAYLACAKALDAQGKHDDAKASAQSALESLKKSLGEDHPDTKTAQEIAGTAAH